ncbi:unnamed protein product [Larinioides sclopetarius]|uniref:Uncharacterized protein n=1 Tax=Larinioides sclopetarius TaxID=280406 RepID=A0AAV2BPR5_9ARAC
MDFCNSTFWNWAAFWNADGPKLPSCFRHSVLMIVPCVILWILSIISSIREFFRRFGRLRSRPGLTPWTKFTVTKLVLTSLLILCSLAEGIYLLSQYNLKNVLISKAYYSSIIIRIFTFVLALYLQYKQNKERKLNSYALSAFWLLFFVCNLFSSPIITAFGVKLEEMTNPFIYTFRMITVIALSAQTLLSFFTDPPNSVSWNTQTNEFQIEQQPLLSRIFFSWMTKFVWHGYRNAFDNDNLPVIKQKMHAMHAFQRFQKQWCKKQRFQEISTEANRTFRKRVTHYIRHLSLTFAVYKSIWPWILITAPIELICSILSILPPILMDYIIQFAGNSEPVWHGYVYAASFFLVASLHTLLLVHNSNFLRNLCFFVHPALSSAIYRKKALKGLEESRTNSVNDVLKNMKTIKLCTWETPIMDRINSEREEEAKVLKKMIIYNGLIFFLWTITPYLFTLGLLIGFAIIKNRHLTPNVAFVTLLISNMILSECMGMQEKISKGNRAFRKVVDFLLRKQIDELVVDDEADIKNAIEIDAGIFQLDRESDPVLQEVTFSVPHGCLAAVVGPEDAEKRALFSTIIGDMHSPLKGCVRIMKGERLAYVGPDPWTLKENIRQEILFGKLMDEERYEAILKLCGLLPDIQNLPDGDLTKVGIRKTRLSEEQLQRVCLARAMYLDADIYLLDEAFNYLSSQGREDIFRHILGPNGLLKRKTRIISTRDLFILPECDKIFFMSEGRISESGSYHQLLQKDGGFAKWVERNLENSTGRKNDRTSILAKIYTSSISDEMEDLEDDDDENTKNGLNLRTVWTYFRFASIPLTFLTFLGFAGYLCFEIGANIWLSKWSSDLARRLDVNSVGIRAGIYVFLGFGQCMSLIISVCCMCFAFKRFAIHLYESIVRSTFRAPVEFFDTTSLNAILQRFGRDISKMDIHIPDIMQAIVGVMVVVLGSFIVISVYHPFFLIVISVTSICFVLLMRFYMTCNRRIQALQYRAQQQVVNSIIDSILAGSTIRAYRSQYEFANLHDELMDSHSRAVLASEQINRWFEIRLQFLANIFVFSAAMFSVAYKSSLNPAHVGLTMFYALNMANKLVRWVPIIAALIEDPMTSLQRIQEYSNSIKPEGFWTREQSPFSPNEWPDRGGIVFQDYSVKRNNGNGFMLQNINVVIPPGQKVAIVGGKGSGKITLVYGLLRAVNSESGTIFVDGVDIAMLGLHDLRSKIAYIPKTPVVFKESIRHNLDPLNKYSDEDLWRAVEMSHLTSCIASLEGGLDYRITKEEILSFGQKQQLSLARALLKNAKILVWDEDPVTEDLETDQLIRNIVTNELADCTVVTLSHRLYTVRDYERVLVMEDGRIVEDGKPAVLMTNTQSSFRQLCKGVGLL